MDRLIVLTILVAFSFFTACSKDSKEPKSHQHKHEKQKSYYTCSMHPQIKEDKPGKCPICHMNLTKIEIDNDSSDLEIASKIEKDVWQCKNFPDVTSEKEDVCPMDGTPMVKRKKENNAAKVVAKVRLRKAQLKHFSPEFFPVTKMKMNKKIRLLGSVLQSEEKESNIPARIDGRIEKVYVKSTGSFVKKGDPVVEFYSPKLITAGEEYILAKKSSIRSKSKEFKDLLRQSKERLRRWGIDDKQFESWYKNEEVPKQITIFSPNTGIVRKRNATTGKYFKEGQNFFELSDLSDVWVEMDVYEFDSSLVKIGQEVKLEFSSLPGEIINGEIDFINPVLDSKSRTLKIRATIKNPHGKLKPGMVANAVLNVSLEGEPFVVPRSAIIDTGKRKVVWVQVNNKEFRAKTILAGTESEGYVEVKEGLMEGEKVVIEGNFLLDAQAQLFGGYEEMVGQK
jgi:hypothetical protein